MFPAQHILVLAPHTDDGELGCGASISKYAGTGSRITYLAFSTCARSLPEGLPPGTLQRECTEATRKLGIADTRFLEFDVRTFPRFRQEILEKLVQLNRELKPDAVFLPAEHDLHQDHRTIYEEGLRAFKSCSVLGYELPWNNTRFSPTYFEPIDDAHLRAKQQSLHSYRSQAHRSYMDADFIRSLAVVRGIQCSRELAEGFEVYKLIGV